MSDLNYGQMAPKQDDGSLLLQDEYLTPDQTTAIKTDAERFAADAAADKRDSRNFKIANRTCLVLLSVNLVVLILSIVGVLNFPMMVTNLISIGAIFYMHTAKSRTQNRAVERLTRRKDMLSGAGAKIPLEMTKRFLAEPEFQMSMYANLVTKKVASVTASGGYSLVLNTDNESKYRVQTVKHEVFFPEVVPER